MNKVGTFRSPLDASLSLPADQNAGEIDLVSFIAAVWRAKWRVFLITALAVLIGGYYGFRGITPTYTATSTVILETNQDQIIDIQSVSTGISGNFFEISSEIEVLKARRLMGKVVDELNLTEDPLFNPKLRSAGIRRQVFQEARQRLNAILNREPKESAPTIELSEERIRDNAVNALLGRTSINNVRRSLVFNISARSPNPDQAALIADTIARLYIENQVEVKLQATERATSWLDARVTELQERLENAESSVAQFNAGTNLVSPEILKAQEIQVKDLRDRIFELKTQQTDASARLAVLKSTTPREAKALVANDPQLTRYAERLNDPAIETAFDLRYDALVDRTQLEITRGERKLSTMALSVEQQQTEIERQNEDLIKLNQLQREAEATRALYEFFLKRYNETSAQLGIQQADSRILSNAVVPLSPSKPRKMLILLISAFLGGIAGAALAVIRELRSSTFRTARDLENFSGYSVLGQIPRIPARSRKAVLRYLFNKPASAVVEAFRNLRTSVMLMDTDDPPKVIMSTSSLPGEGKTTNSLALAQNFSGLGKKVLLIEGDIRRRTFSDYFKDLPKLGLVSLVFGEAELDEVKYRAKDFDVDVIAGEKSKRNAADIFASKQFEKLLDELRDAYDVIIVDTPPVLVVPDARIIGEYVDSILITVKWDKTSKEQLSELLRMFQSSKSTVTGLILSQIDPRGMKKYGYGGQYGAYSAYGSKYYSR